VSEKIEFVAEVRQVKTMADGTVTVILNLPEYCIEQGKRFIDWHHLLISATAKLESGQE
jgi:hypothetical protein